MQIAILGAGKTGAYIAKVLSERQHDVTLIDQNSRVLEQVRRESDLAILHATGPSIKLFEEVGEGHPHLFFAATGDDATNLVACTMAKQFGFAKTVTRVKDKAYLPPARLDFGRLFAIDHFIHAESLAARDLFNAITHAGDIAAEYFAHGAIQMRTLQIPPQWDREQMPLAKLSLPEDLIVGLIRRKQSDGEKILFPHGNDHILPGDEVTVVGKAKVMHRLHEIFHVPEHRVRSVILVGGTAVVSYLADCLSQQRIAVRIIENDDKRCIELAESLPQATIIHRDGRDPQLLKAERVQDADALVSCTYHDGDNLLIASLAKQIGCPKTIALIGDPSYAPILEKSGVLPALSSRVNVANRLLSILHEETILSISSLGCDIAKIVEVKVSPSSPLIGTPLSALSHYLPKDLLITVIETQGKVMIGKGSQTLSPEDTVILICHHEQIPKISQLFR